MFYGSVSKILFDVLNPDLIINNIPQIGLEQKQFLGWKRLTGISQYLIILKARVARKQYITSRQINYSVIFTVGNVLHVNAGATASQFFPALPFVFQNSSLHSEGMLDGRKVALRALVVYETI